LTGVRRIAVLTGMAAFAVAGGFLAGRPSEVGTASVFAFGAVISLLTVRDLAAGAVVRVHGERREDDSPPVEQLREVARALAAAQQSEFGVDRELRPLFRPIAAVRLARRGVDIDRHREEACLILGEELWGLVRVDRDRGANRVEGGISAVRLRAMIERLEAI
jgi:hypothetical protein